MKRNDEDRLLWVLNDQGLCNMFLRSKHRSEAAFVRTHRAIIDEVVDKVTSGAEPAHYLAYPRPRV